MPDITRELASFGVDAVIHDAHADAAEAMHEYGIKKTKWEEIRNLGGLIIAVGNKTYKEMGQDKLLSLVRHGGVVLRSTGRMGASDRGPSGWS